MPQSLSKVLLHITFSTKHRKPFLQSPDIRRELFAYMATICRELKCPALIINGVTDHIHILCQLARTVTQAQLLEELKTQTSKWLKTKGPEYHSFHWQNGYAAFSVSESNLEKVKLYIERQEQHHAKMSYQEELRLLCQKHGITLDERYCWD